MAEVHTLFEGWAGSGGAGSSGAVGGASAHAVGGVCDGRVGGGVRLGRAGSGYADRSGDGRTSGRVTAAGGEGYTGS
ncbi:hypothetical protein GCM10025331_73770 [Actinoplanes utahensis]|nr:hypothetical protein Aut01nite_79290 [Actinoplanes utahensis]